LPIDVFNTTGDDTQIFRNTVNMKIKIIAITLLLLMPINEANAWLFGPSNFEDCVIDGIKNAKSDAAASLVTQACALKFPNKEKSKEVKCGKKSIPSNERSKVSFNLPLNTVGSGEYYAKIGRIEYEQIGGYGKNLLVAYVQSNLPVNLGEVVLKGYEVKGQKSIGSYQCLGNSSPKTTGRFVCYNTDPKAKFFELESVVTVETSIVELLKNLGAC
jgi:hypothetical protein